MAHTVIESVAADFKARLRRSRSLAIAAHQWIDPASGPKKPKFTRAHRHALVELAFLRSCLAWETFLEDTFLLYMLGKKPRLRKVPRKRYITPTNREHAVDMLLPEHGGREFVEWDKPDKVLTRAKRLLRGGEPFEAAMTPRLNTLFEMRTIRNAIAHRSIFSQRRFHAHARNILGALPPGLTVGSYLETLTPGSLPPTTEFDRYLDAIEAAAGTIAR